jgi:hypothetical protein
MFGALVDDGVGVRAEQREVPSCAYRWLATLYFELDTLNLSLRLRLLLILVDHHFYPNLADRTEKHHLTVRGLQHCLA